jgi:hypothetical protein
MTIILDGVESDRYYAFGTLNMMFEQISCGIWNIKKLKVKFS